MSELADAALRRLGVLVGEWTTESTHRALPGTVVHGVATFVDDCDADIADMRANGVEVVEEPQDQPVGTADGTCPRSRWQPIDRQPARCRAVILTYSVASLPRHARRRFRMRSMTDPFLRSGSEAQLPLASSSASGSDFLAV